MLADGSLIDPFGRTRAFDRGDGSGGPLSWHRLREPDRVEVKGGRLLQASPGWAFAELLPRDLDDGAIALGLSGEARYLGQTIRHFTVAQHASEVGALACMFALDDGAPAREAIAAAAAGHHHDDPEGLGLHDWAAPLKRGHPTLLGPALRAQRDMARLVEARFGLRRGATEQDIVRRADQVAFAHEAANLMPPDPRWPTDPFPGLRIVALSPRAASAAWLQTSRALEVLMQPTTPDEVVERAALELVAPYRSPPALAPATQETTP